MARIKAFASWTGILPKYRQIVLVIVFAALLPKSEASKKALWSKLRTAHRGLASQPVIRINCGGGTYVDSAGNTWSADTSFFGGAVYWTIAPITNTDLDVLYQSERFGDSFSYSIPVSNGGYKVNLYFAEIYHDSAGKRLFDIALEGTQLKSNVDIFAVVGKSSPLIFTGDAAVAAGMLLIQFTSITDNAKVSAIEVIPVPSVVRINCGGGTFVDSTGNTWSADTSFSGGGVYSTTATITNTNLAILYQSERYGGTFSYSISLADGGYEVNLYFAEIYHDSSGKRLFNIAIQGTQFQSNVDIFAVVGKNSPLVFTTDATVAAGVMVIQFTTIADNAKVSAIELVPWPSVVRINCGGGAFLDSADNMWSADSSFSGGVVYSTTATIANTNSGILYQSERYGGTFSYSISLPNGDYVVNLYFAEIYHGSAGKRLFDIALQGTQFKSNVDIFAVVGKNSPLVFTIDAAVAAGVLSIHFTTIADNAKVSAIEVVPLSSSQLWNQPPFVNAGLSRVVRPYDSVVVLAATASDDGRPNPPAGLSYQWSQLSGPGVTTFSSVNALQPSAKFDRLGTYTLEFKATDGSATTNDDIVLVIEDGVTTLQAVRINCGGTSFTDPAGNIWQADNNFVGGATYATAAMIVKSQLLQLYQTERYESHIYNIALSNGLYAVSIHLAEIYFSTPGSRVFDIYVQGQQVFGDVDIADAVGKNAAWILYTGATVSNGQLMIELKSVIQNAKISGIEAIPIAGNAPPTVFAGADREVVVNAVADLEGKASDDGKPQPASLSYAWKQLTGPATVGFTLPTALSTSATFTKAGSYVLQLTVYDGDQSAVDTVTVFAMDPETVIDGIRINCGGPAYIDPSGLKWSADRRYFGSTTTYATNAGITHTSNPFVYQSERFGDEFFYKLFLPNGVYEVKLHFAEIYWTTKGSRIFSVSLQGADVLTNVDIYARWGVAFAAVFWQFQVEVRSGELVIGLVSSVDHAKISGIEITPSLDTLLHVVIGLPSVIVDYERRGFVPVLFDGVGAHTHELGRVLRSWKWVVDGSNVGEGQKLVTPVSLGIHTVTLTIGDDNVPPRYLSGSSDFTVSPIDAVSGAYVRYYAVSGKISTFIDSLPTYADFEEVRPDLSIEQFGQQIGGSPFSTAVVEYTFYIIFAGGLHELVASAALYRVFIDEVRVVGASNVNAGKHSVRVIVGVDSGFVFPGDIRLKTNGGPAIPVDVVKHDEISLRPFINTVPGYVSTDGGDSVTIKGVGFFPTAAVVVKWGDQDLMDEQIIVQSNTITLTSLPGETFIDITVLTPNGPSNTVRVFRQDAPPVRFISGKIADAQWVTRVVWGPDNRIYASSLSGLIYIFTVDDSYNVINTQVVTTLQSSMSNQVNALAFNPKDPPSPVKLYVGHEKFYQDGGTCFTGSSEYLGRITLLEGPAFDKPVTIINNLPVSNHDHGVNDMLFDDQGDLLFLIGSNTNRGIPACAMGALPESPLTAALMKADVSSPTYNGNITYIDIATGAVNLDQVSGAQVNVVMSSDIMIYASGLRNAFCMTLTGDGRLYATDNSGNAGFGSASLSATTQTDVGDEHDRLYYVVQDQYYGHPNRNRGRVDNRQNIYRSVQTPSILGMFTQPAGIFPSSTDGIAEYRAMTFGGQLFGHLLVQHWNAEMYDVVLSPNGRTVDSATPIAGAPSALTHTTGPGGVIIAADYSDGAVVVSQPIITSKFLAAYDFHPRRAGVGHQAEFVIGGTLFVNDVRVTLGGVACEITYVAPTRIKGKIPVASAPTAALLDVVVQAGNASSVIRAAFRYILLRGAGQGIWQAEAEAPLPLQEPVGGVINGVIYVVAANVPDTLAFDVGSGTWVTTLAKRPFVGAGHSAEVVQGTLYLFGGIGGGSQAMVQIYDPATNSWRAGANLSTTDQMSSAATAVIGTQVFLIGGIKGAATLSTIWIYDTKNDAWIAGPSMPQGRSRAAGGTDGKRVYVFGGRNAADSAASDFDTVQIYDAATHKWSISTDSASGIAPMPEAKSTMGKAIFYKREFYLIAGQTNGGTSDRVDVYDPATNTWRREAPLPSPRSGALPLLHGSRVCVIGGGVSDVLHSPTHQVFHR